MSDTPISDSEDGQDLNGVPVNKGWIRISKVREIEYALAAATKERDEALRVITTLEEMDSSSCDTISDLRAQLSALQSATPRDHSQAIEEAHESFEKIRLLLVSNLKEPARSAFWESVFARDKLQAILTPQPRKEGDEPCAQNHAGDAAESTERTPTTADSQARARFAATGVQASGAAHLRFDPKNSLEEAVLKIAKERDEALQEAKRWRNVARSYDDSPSRRFLEEFKQLKNRASLLDVENHTLVQKFNTLETRTVGIAIDRESVRASHRTQPTEATATAPSVSEAAEEFREYRSLSRHGWDQESDASRKLESILTRITGDHAKRIAELEADKVRLRKALEYVSPILDVITRIGRLAQGGEQTGNWIHVAEADKIVKAAMKEQP